MNNNTKGRNASGSTLDGRNLNGRNLNGRQAVRAANRAMPDRPVLR